MFNPNSKDYSLPLKTATMIFALNMISLICLAVFFIAFVTGYEIWEFLLQAAVDGIFQVKNIKF